MNINDEVIISPDAAALDIKSTEICDEQETPEQTQSEPVITKEEKEAEGSENSELSDETDSQKADEIVSLKAELESLKRELHETRSFYERLDGECEEFASLYPEVALSEISDSVWQSVKQGLPLSAAYALEARRETVRKARAGEVNRENTMRSSGAISSDNYNSFFTPAEVKAMSPAEVRANYTKIINSMSKWH